MQRAQWVGLGKWAFVALVPVLAAAGCSGGKVTVSGKVTYKGVPLVPTVIFRPVPDAGTRMADLLNGTADMIFDVSPDDLDTLRSRAGEGFQVVTGNAAKLQFIEFMPKKATDPLADRRVRQALNLAVDADAIITNLFKGLGTRQYWYRQID